MPRDAPTKLIIDTMSNMRIFLSRRNIYYMSYTIKAINKKTAANININEDNIINIMIDWAVKNDIDRIDLALDDIIQNLEYINNQFLNSYKKLYVDANKLNVYKMSGNITDEYGNSAVKKYDELQATDYHTLDLWNNVDIYVTNANSRYNNKIPTWQKSMNTRHYDTENDGLRAAIPERASLNNQVHGYDMSNIIKGAESNYVYQK